MKRNYFITLAFALLALASCRGTEVEDTNPNGNTQPTDPSEEVYTLSADATAIDADGKQKVTFALTNSKGENLCEKDPGMVKITNATEGEWLGYGIHSFSSIRNGEYDFTATYRGYDAANSVTVKVQNRAKYEKYLQKVCIYKITGAWCSFCPNMTANLKAAADLWGENMIIIACHGGNNGPDPFKLSPDVSLLLLGQYNSSSYPSCIYDNNTFVAGQGNSATVVKNIVKQLSDYPATCGVRIDQAEKTGSTLKVKATIASDKGDSYDVGCIVLGDGFEYAAGTEPSGIYNNVMVALSGSLNLYNKDTAVEIAAGSEVSKEFTFENFTATDTSKYSVVVYAMTRNAAGQTNTDNAAICKVGEKMNGFILND